MKKTIQYFLFLVVTSVSTAAYAQNSQQKSLLWLISNNTGSVYVFGSLHVGKAEFYPFAPAIENAFSKSEVLAVEADISNLEASFAIAKRAFYQAPDNLERNISSPIMARLLAIVSKYGLDPNQVKQMKPWMLASTLEMAEVGKLGYSPLLGTEFYLLQKAKTQGKAIIEVESIEFQADVMESLTAQEQEAFLEGALSSIEKGAYAKMIASLVQAWRLGDEEGLSRTIAEASKGLRLVDAIHEKINYSRNPGITSKIETFLRSGKTHFVAVGALHLLGKRGVIEMLRAKGYKVIQL